MADMCILRIDLQPETAELFIARSLTASVVRSPGSVLGTGRPDGRSITRKVHRYIPNGIAAPGRWVGAYVFPGLETPNNVRPRGREAITN